MSLIDKLGAQKEAAAFYHAVDEAVSPQERTVIVKAGESLLWALAWRVLVKLGLPLGAVAAIGLTVLGSQATQTTPPGVASEPEINVVAREPGATYQAEGLVCDPAAVVLKPQDSPFMQADAVGPVLTAQRGSETIVWSSNNFTNPQAIYYVKPAGGPQEQQDAAVSAKAQKCFKEKAGLK